MNLSKFSLTLDDWGYLLKAVGSTSIRCRPTGIRPLVKDIFKGHLLRIPLDLCLNQYAFSYGTKGWNYFVDLAKELLLEPERDFRETVFYEFFQSINPPTYTDLLTLNIKNRNHSITKIPFGSYPWGHFDMDICQESVCFLDLTSARESQTCMWPELGDSINDILEREVEKTRKLVNSIKSRGYQVGRSHFRLPTVSRMINRKGDVVFIQHDGAHRLAILAALKYKTALVRLDPIRYPDISESAASTWSYVKSGLVTETSAIDIFNLYFELDGRERTLLSLGQST